MPSLRSRLARLEDRIGQGCRACIGREVVKVWRVGEEPEPDPARCGSCGRDMSLVVQLVYDTPPVPERPIASRPRRGSASRAGRSVRRRREG